MFTSSAGPSNEAIEETETAQGPVRNRFECPSPANRKRPRSCLAESGQTMAGRIIQRDNATGSYHAAEEDARHDEEDSRPPLGSSSRQIDSDPDQEVVPEETTPDAYLPHGWTRIKLEPDW